MPRPKSDKNKPRSLLSKKERIGKLRVNHILCPKCKKNRVSGLRQFCYRCLKVLQSEKKNQTPDNSKPIAKLSKNSTAKVSKDAPEPIQVSPRKKDRLDPDYQNWTKLGPGQYDWMTPLILESTGGFGRALRKADAYVRNNYDLIRRAFWDRGVIVIQIERENQYFEIRFAD